MCKMVEVDITSAGKHYLMAELVRDGQVYRPDKVPATLTKGQVSGIQSLKDNLHTEGHPLWVKVTVGVVLGALAAKLTLRLLKINNT